MIANDKKRLLQFFKEIVQNPKRVAGVEISVNGQPGFNITYHSGTGLIAYSTIGAGRNRGIGFQLDGKLYFFSNLLTAQVFPNTYTFYDPMSSDTGFLTILKSVGTVLPILPSRKFPHHVEGGNIWQPAYEMRRYFHPGRIFPTREMLEFFGAQLDIYRLHGEAAGIKYACLPALKRLVSHLSLQPLNL